MTTTSQAVSVVLPAFNEVDNLEGVVRRLDRVLDALAPTSEIIIVDDGSSDGTGALADELARALPRVRVLRHASNSGYGAAQRTGLGAATRDLVCLLPADGQVPPEELARYLDAAGEADVIVGRYRKRPDPVMRRILSRVYVLVLRVLYGVRLQNINAPKLFRREQLAGVEIASRGGFADAEIVLQLSQQGRRFHEVYVECAPRTAGQSSIGARAAFQALWELWAFHRASRARAASAQADERRTRA